MMDEQIPAFLLRIPEFKLNSYQISSCKISSFTSFTALMKKKTNQIFMKMLIEKF